jgi:hypothetical protein
MQWIERYRQTSITALAIASLGLGGCIEYRIETDLHADGSGVRQEKMLVEEFEDEADNERFRSIFGYLMFVTEDFRWDHREEVDDGDTLQVFVRETPISDIQSWVDLTGKVHIAGTDLGSDASIGSIPLSDVHFRNRVRVETGRVSGGTSYTYRETFYWENLAEVLIEYLAQAFVDGVATRYPDVDTRQQEALRSAARAGGWFAVGQGIFEAGGDEEDEIVSTMARRIAGRAVQIVEESYPNVREEFFEGLVKRIYDDDDNRFEDFVLEELPGVELAINSEIVFHLRMPGRITASNAHDRDRNTLIWEFAPGDALSAPLEIVAESVVER